MWYWHKDRHVDENRIERSEIKPHIYSQFFLDKDDKKIKNKSFQQIMIRLAIYM